MTCRSKVIVGYAWHFLSYHTDENGRVEVNVGYAFVQFETYLKHSPEAWHCHEVPKLCAFDCQME